jgi:carboxylate-amine ligase
MIEQAFGQSTPWSVGVEEEIMILDADTLAMTPAVRVLTKEAASRELPGTLKTELFASVVELTTGICASVAEGVEALAVLRRTVAEIAHEHGLEVAAAGTHPVSAPEQQAIVDESRYKDFVGYAGVSARRQGVNGLHVHVGMPDAAACFRALEGALPWLPLVLALSANSPYLGGRATGLASNRAEILAQLPRSGAPPAFASYEDWESFVERLTRIGLVKDYTVFWWDIRPHPRFGTLEVRMPDQPTALGSTAVFAALLQALCVTVLEGGSADSTPARRGDYAQNRWAALRFGPDAELIHPDGDRLVRVPELARELLERVAPAAESLGTRELLDGLTPDTCEAERQLAVGREQGLAAVCSDLVERTLRSA